jgi:mono/diheme cytochrome c family protein
MSWTRKTVLAAVLGATTLAIVASCGSYQAASKAPLSGAEQVARGRYLTVVGGCNDCHTPGTFYGAPDTTRVLSGSELGWVGPWGTTYPRNLTPDLETGLGKYSAADIVRAIRTGQRLDGSPLLPPMPWPNYAQMTDEDLMAVAVYLKSLPAVSHKVPDRLSPGAQPPSALVFPPPPAWDGQNLPPPPAATENQVGTKK